MDRSPPGSSLQNGTNKQKGEESASQSNKAKLYCVNSRLSKLKECVCPEIGTWVLIFWNSQEQQSWWYMLSFVKFALWNGRYLSILFSFPLVYGQNYIFSLELVLSTSKVDHRCWEWEAGRLGSCLWDLWIQTKFFAETKDFLNLIFSGKGDKV